MYYNIEYIDIIIYKFVKNKIYNEKTSYLIRYQ